DLKMAWPSSLLRLRVTPRLLALSKRKYTPSCPGFSANARLPWSPPRGDSTLTTSAPSQASISVHEVPASNWVRSNTFTFAMALLIQSLLSDDGAMLRASGGRMQVMRTVRRRAGRDGPRRGITCDL